MSIRHSSDASSTHESASKKNTATHAPGDPMALSITSSIHAAAGTESSLPSVAPRSNRELRVSRRGFSTSPQKRPLVLRPCASRKRHSSCSASGGAVSNGSTRRAVLRGTAARPDFLFVCFLVGFFFPRQTKAIAENERKQPLPCALQTSFCHLALS